MSKSTHNKSDVSEHSSVEIIECVKTEDVQLIETVHKLVNKQIESIYKGGAAYCGEIKRGLDEVVVRR